MKELIDHSRSDGQQHSEIIHEDGEDFLKCHVIHVNCSGNASLCFLQPPVFDFHTMDPYAIDELLFELFVQDDGANGAAGTISVSKFLGVTCELCY